MARTASIGDIILIADNLGDRPAIITRADTATMVEACALMPMPEHLKVVKIHDDRREARNAALRSTGYHAYWKA
jgi:hypothetical protein